MNIKIGLLSVFMLSVSVYAGAQTARNPLNHEPARVTLKKNPSSWKLADETFYRADGVQFDKRSFTYDANGRIASEINQRSSGRDNSWQNTSKCDYIYKDNKIVVISSVMNLTGWQNTSKVETVNNPEGNPVHSLSYSWDSSVNDWSVDPSLKCEWTYDENNRISEYTKKYRNKEANEWSDLYARIIYLYGEDGEILEELFQLRNKENDSWVNGGKYAYSKGEKNQKIAMSYFFSSDKWVFDGKTIYAYDEEGKVFRGEYFGNNPDESLNAYSLYTYSENSFCQVLSETEDINIYPNPAVYSVELSVPNVLVGKVVNVFDTWGKHVKSFTANGEKTQVDVSGLPEGIYILHVGEKTKKLVVNRR